MTSTTAMESKNISNSQTDDKLHRGRNVVLAFLMQGMSSHPIIPHLELCRISDGRGTTSLVSSRHPPPRIWLTSFSQDGVRSSTRSFSLSSF